MISRLHVQQTECAAARLTVQQSLTECAYLCESAQVPQDCENGFACLVQLQGRPSL